MGLSAEANGRLARPEYSDPRFGIPCAAPPDDNSWVPPARIWDTVDINGVTVSATALVQVLNNLTDPDPKRWYRYERQGDIIIIETKRGTE